MNKKTLVTALALSSMMFWSCESDENENPNPIITGENSLYVLCEGNWGYNNATLDLFSIDSNSVQKDFFAFVNGFGLGDTGNDMIAYGSKIYVAVKVSNVVIVINRQNGKQIARIPMVDNAGQGKMPSRLCSADGKVYVACFDGYVAEIDTTSLNVVREVKAGRNPDGIAFANGKLFVANSGGLDYPNYDNTISVIQLPALLVIDTIEIETGLNPTLTRTLPDGNIMVLVNGNYYDVNPSLVTINSQTNAIIKQDNVNVSSFVIKNNDVVYLHFDYTTNIYNVKTAPYNNIENGSVDFVKQSSIFSSMTTPYCLSVSKERQEIYMTDAKNYTSSGEVICFDYDGNLKYRFSTSQNPSVVIVK
ncbi:MAG: hypothetical protein LBR17_05620 [Bacteroidales bacterium]|jgi:outer membrane protein assembly factor BamB|nr:hypothetical protein [Bacteroidales bacterium]